MTKQKKKGFLDSVYKISDADKMHNLYEEWAESYDEEIVTHGYATPYRCATALAAVAHDKSAPLLDIGCGTGISGKAFLAAGFTTIDGSDLSGAMLKKAKIQGIYRKLWQTDLVTSPNFSRGDYAYLAAVGVIAAGHMPPECIPSFLALLGSSGMMVFSLNDHTLENPAFEAELRRLEQVGEVIIRHEDYGDHLPSIGLKSKVFVVEKQ